MIIVMVLNLSKMNDYAKEGKRFLETLDDYFKEFEKVIGYSVVQYMMCRNLSLNSIPDPIKIVDSLDMFCHTGGEYLTLFIHKRPGFDGYCTFLDSEGKISDGGIRVFVSDMGAWQVTLLLVMSMHVMPMYWHAYYMHWTPIFCDKDLQKLTKAERQFSTLEGETYEFLPKDLPTEPTVIPIEEGKKYQTSFYVWSDFNGYRKVVSTITFPSTHFSTVRDIEIKTEIENIVQYRAHMIL